MDTRIEPRCFQRLHLLGKGEAPPNGRRRGAVAPILLSLEMVAAVERYRSIGRQRVLRIDQLQAELRWVETEAIQDLAGGCGGRRRYGPAGVHLDDQAVFDSEMARDAVNQRHP